MDKHLKTKTIHAANAGTKPTPVWYSEDRGKNQKTPPQRRLFPPPPCQHPSQPDPQQATDSQLQAPSSALPPTGYRLRPPGSQIPARIQHSRLDRTALESNTARLRAPNAVFATSSAALPTLGASALPSEICHIPRKAASRNSRRIKHPLHPPRRGGTLRSARQEFRGLVAEPGTVGFSFLRSARRCTGTGVGDPAGAWGFASTAHPTANGGKSADRLYRDRIGDCDFSAG